MRIRLGALHEAVHRKEAARHGVVAAAVHINKAEGRQVLVAGEAAVKSVAHVGIAEAIGVAATPPGVVAQPLHGIAADGGREAALVVFQGVVHGAYSVG